MTRVDSSWLTAPPALNTCANTFYIHIPLIYSTDNNKTQSAPNYYWGSCCILRQTLRSLNIYNDWQFRRTPQKYRYNKIASSMSKFHKKTFHTLKCLLGILFPYCLIFLPANTYLNEKKYRKMALVDQRQAPQRPTRVAHAIGKKSTLIYATCRPMLITTANYSLW